MKKVPGPYHIHPNGLLYTKISHSCSSEKPIHRLVVSITEGQRNKSKETKQNEIVASSALEWAHITLPLCEGSLGLALSET